MVVEERKNIGLNNIVQNIVMENRNKLSVSGVKDVISFDDELVIIETELGLLTVKGNNLKINKLSIDTGDVSVEGEISNLGYSDPTKKSQEQGLFSKIFK
ncbi:MAG TPA: sporulation protein YabP [Clostridiales bacterium]|nr:sporulation protein YabP [Clostridiales bacterium]